MNGILFEFVDLENKRCDVACLFLDSFQKQFVFVRDNVFVCIARTWSDDSWSYLVYFTDGERIYCWQEETVFEYSFQSTTQVFSIRELV